MGLTFIGPATNLPVTNGTHHILSRPTFDPRVLLAPRAATKRSKGKDLEEDLEDAHDSMLLDDGTASSHSIPGARWQNETGQEKELGMGSMIEKMHKVEKRECRPMKKQKKENGAVDEDDDLVDVKKKAEFSNVKSSGELGQYIKEKREEALNGQGPTAIDLTNDDDDVVEIDNPIASKADVKANQMQEVCLGRLEGPKVNAHRVPTPKMTGFQGSKGHWQPMKVTLRRRPGANTSIIGCLDPHDKDFGTIDARSATALAPLMDAAPSTKIRFQARLDMRERKPFEYPGQQVSDSYNITINVYAPRMYAKGIGQVCSRSQLWLRAPLAVDRGIEVFNPHEPKDNAPAKKSQLLASTARYGTTSYVSRTNEEVRRDVMKIFECLKSSDDLPGMDPPACVVTELLPHQRQALWFMTEREKGKSKDEEKEGDEEAFSLWKEQMRPSGEVRWYNVITGHELREDPGPILGGILADVMGLGKTLNVLSLITSSLREADIWARQIPDKPMYEDDPKPAMNTKGTLLVCPLSTMTNWEDQMKTHLKDKTLSYYIYHGAKRTDDIHELRMYDLVITSYSVVSADYDRRSRKRVCSPLTQLNWFRIVLDEAHMIREQTTRQSKAICMLPAQRRWAVTGTPVQNRLEDLGALIKFLRIRPFEQKGNFAQFIIAPFKSMDTEILPKLRLLVDSITLRRGKDKLNLPPRHEQIVRLKFTDAEKGLYDWFTIDSQNKVKAMLGKKGVGGSAYAHILRAILRLRLLCAHGGELLSDEDYGMAKGFSVNNAIDLEDEDDERPDRTPRQAFEMVRMMKDANMNTCAKCDRCIDPVKENLDGFLNDEDSESDTDADVTLGYLTPCNQLICPKCINGFRKELKEAAGPDNFAKCTICETYIRVTFFEIKQRELVADEKALLAVKQNPRLAKHASRYSGPHTKTKALLEAMAEDEKWSEEHPDEMPIKSVVFSGWTSHLDLIQIALTDNKVNFTRLDGSMSRSSRTTALTTFAESRDITCILVSLTAGGLGLNLTAASRVYVMEPQFNPAAEAQAIERVHRLGQKRPVQINRFIMADSFEEKMLLLQKKKQDLANLSMERDNMKMGRAEVAKQKMEELKSLFK